MKKNKLLVTALIVLSIFVSCGDPLSNPQANQLDLTPVLSLTLDKTEIKTYASAASQTVEAQITPVFAANKKITWIASDPNIISLVPSTDTSTVSVSGLHSGTSTVTAISKDGAKTASFTVSIGQEPVTSATVLTASSSARINWVDPVNPDFQKIEIETSSNDTGASIPATVEVAKGIGTLLLSGNLSPDKNYIFTIRAVDKYGVKSSPITFNSMTYANPPPVTSPTFYTLGTGGSYGRITWTDPAYLDLKEIKVQISSSTGGANIPPDTIVPKGIGRTTISGLTSGAAYTINLTAVDTSLLQSTVASASATATDRVVILESALASYNSHLLVASCTWRNNSPPTNSYDVISGEKEAFIPSTNIPASNYKWRVHPGLSNPNDQNLVSFENMTLPGYYMRIYGSNTSWRPAAVGQWFSWNIEADAANFGVLGLGLTHLLLVDTLGNIGAATSDATFKLVPGVANPAKTAIQWGTDNAYYVITRKTKEAWTGARTHATNAPTGTQKFPDWTLILQP